MLISLLPLSGKPRDLARAAHSGRNMATRSHTDRRRSEDGWQQQQQITAVCLKVDLSSKSSEELLKGLVIMCQHQFTSTKFTTLATNFRCLLLLDISHPSSWKLLWQSRISPPLPGHSLLLVVIIIGVVIQRYSRDAPSLAVEGLV